MFTHGIVLCLLVGASAFRAITRAPPHLRACLRAAQGGPSSSIEALLERLLDGQELTRGVQKEQGKTLTGLRGEIKVMRGVQEEQGKTLTGLRGEIKSLKSMTKNMSEGLGLNFELYNRAILTLLQLEEISDGEIIVNKKFPDPEGKVHPFNKEFELDLFSEGPLMIAEVTTFLKETELTKVESFIRAKHFIHKLYGVEPRSYFMTFEVAPKIRHQVKELLSQNNVRLVSKNLLI